MYGGRHLTFRNCCKLLKTYIRQCFHSLHVRIDEWKRSNDINRIRQSEGKTNTHKYTSHNKMTTWQSWIIFRFFYSIHWDLYSTFGIRNERWKTQENRRKNNKKWYEKIPRWNMCIEFYIDMSFFSASNFIMRMVWVVEQKRERKKKKNIKLKWKTETEYNFS